MSVQPASDVVELLKRAYGAFNAKDVEAVLAVMRPDVDWPNVLEAVRLHGRDQIKKYWTRQFAAIDPQLEVRSITPAADGRVVVELRQIVRALDGTIRDDRIVKHVYTIRDGLVARMDILAD
jgi:uncharacterized protein (TIGR02246 family)